MKVIDLFEYKNKYYKAIPKKPKARGKKTLWYDQYEQWVGDIQSRFPDANVFYDEENEEIIAGADGCKECYGKWSKNAKGAFKGVTFTDPRNVNRVSKNAQALRQVYDTKEKPLKKTNTGGGFSGQF